jgi:hypothetical protein
MIAAARLVVGSSAKKPPVMMTNAKSSPIAN